MERTRIVTDPKAEDGVEGTRKRGPQPPPGFPSEDEILQTLPPYDGKKTVGVLVTEEGNVVPLQSLKTDQADPRYANYFSATHVEGQAAIYIRDNGSAGGVVYHNNPNGTCGQCDFASRDPPAERSNTAVGASAGCKAQ